MKSFFNIALLVIVAVLFTRAEANGDSSAPDCSVNNGNCSDFCIFSPEDNATAFCSCQCGKVLLPDNCTCVFPFICDTDIYIAIDVFDYAVTGDEHSDQWERWQVYAACFVEDFTTLEQDSNVTIGIQVYTSDLQTIDNYTAIQVPEAYSFLNDLGRPIDETWSIDFPGVLPRVGNNVAGDPGFVYEGPFDGLRARSNTTSVAIGLVFKFNDTLSDDAILDSRELALMSFNDIIVITTAHFDYPAEFGQENTERARLYACGSRTQPCSKVFFVDKNNDFDIPLVFEAVINEINDKGCHENIVVPTPVISVTCDEGMEFTLSRCPLAGVTLDDLQFINSTCDLNQFVTAETEDLVTISLNFGECGTFQEFIAEDGTVRNQFTQIITTRIFGPDQSLPEVNYRITCSIGTLTGTYTAWLRPKFDIKAGAKKSFGNFEVSMLTYTDPTFSTQTEDLKFVIGCPVYVEATAKAFDGFEMVLSTCFATRSSNFSDAERYILADSGCAVDRTFEILTNPTADVSRFKFNMFEFSDGYKIAVEDKPPVYIHCIFWVCLPGDNSIFCNSSCFDIPGRKRRALDEETKPESVMTTLGPFIVEEGEIKKVDGTDVKTVEVEQPIDIEKYPALEVGRQVVDDQRLQVNMGEYKTKQVEEKQDQQDKENIKETDDEQSINDVFSSIRHIKIIMPPIPESYSRFLMFILLMMCLAFIIFYGCDGIKRFTQRKRRNYSQFPEEFVDFEYLQNKDLPPPQYQP